MSIQIRLKKYKNSTKSSYGKYYAETVRGEEIHTPQLAQRICDNTTFRPGEVKGLIEELVCEMTHALHDGQTVVLDGFGRFRLMAESVGVEQPEEFNLAKHIRRIVCKFLPEGRRDRSIPNPTVMRLARRFADKADVIWAPGAKP